MSKKFTPRMRNFVQRFAHLLSSLNAFFFHFFFTKSNLCNLSFQWIGNCHTFRINFSAKNSTNRRNSLFFIEKLRKEKCGCFDFLILKRWKSERKRWFQNGKSKWSQIGPSAMSWGPDEIGKTFRETLNRSRVE